MTVVELNQLISRYISFAYQRKNSKKLTDESSLLLPKALRLFRHSEFQSWQTLEQYWPWLLHGQKFLPLSRMQLLRHEQVVKLSKFGTDARSSISLISNSSREKLRSKPSAMFESNKPNTCFTNEIWYQLIAVPLLYNIAELNKQYLLNAYCFSAFLYLLMQNFTHLATFNVYLLWNTLFSLLVSKGTQNIN